MPRSSVPGPDDRYRRAARSLALLARVLERATGDLSLAQYRVLAMVAGGDERSSLVAERLSVARPTVTAVVDGLVERGLLSRASVADDRRQIRLQVTAAGRKALDSAEKAMAERVESLTEDVSDREALFAGLAQVEATLEARMTERLRAVRR